MYSRFTIASKYLNYLLTAANGKGHGIHSPFVFDFVTKVLCDRREPEVFRRIETYRTRMLRSKETVSVEDFGAGSVYGTTKQRSIQSIARNAAKGPKYGRLLHRITLHYRCAQILELGTSLGISTAYLASAPDVRRVLTLEGAPAIARAAQEGIDSLGLHHVEQLVGNFDETLAEALIEMPAPDLIFFDGNHREEPTLRYFHQCLPHAGEETIFIFDDIHWSAEMESAWGQIKNHESVTCTIDLFFMGIVFFRNAFKEKQHFTIRY